MRYVCYSPELGVYLGSFLGMGFWSKIDPVGQDQACTFESEGVMREYIATWDSPVEGCVAVAVETGENGYAAIAQCVAAGLPGWEP